MCSELPLVKQKIKNELCCLWPFNIFREREKQLHKPEFCPPCFVRSPTVALFGNSLSLAILKISCHLNLCIVPPHVLLSLK